MNDDELIRIAERTHYTNWFDIDELFPKAQSEETLKTLEAIKFKKRMQEEYLCGLQ